MAILEHKVCSILEACSGLTDRAQRIKVLINVLYNTTHFAENKTTKESYLTSFTEFFEDLVLICRWISRAT